MFYNIPSLIHPVKEIYDGVLGFIPITELELEIIQHPLFQRLRHITQLGNAQYVFPGATHSRFAHSLGVMHIADLMASRIAEKCSWGENEIEKIRLAGLLHDIGHYPFSHTIESVYLEKEGLHHEKLGTVVLKNSSLGDIIRHNYEIEEISGIFNKAHSDHRYNQLLNSDLDADRTDYLLRDSYHTGVRYGDIDYNQLIRKLTLNDDGRVCIDYHAKRAAEHYVLARFHMYAQVYNHKTVRAMDIMQRQLAMYALDQQKLPSPDDLAKHFDENSFFDYDDHFLTNVIKVLRTDNNEKISDMANMYLLRKPLNCAYEMTEFAQQNKLTGIFYLKFLEQQFEAGKDIGDIPRDWIFFDTDDIITTKLKPVFDLDEITKSGDELKETTHSAIFVTNRNGESNLLINDKSSIIQYVAGLKYEIGRVYTIKKFKDQLAAEIENEIKKYHAY